jgi:hypothetical protein
MNKIILVVLFVASTAFFANAYTNDENEELRLNEVRDKALKECHGDTQCRQAVRKKYEAAGYLLRTDPEKYWKYGSGAVEKKKKRNDVGQDDEINQNSHGHSHASQTAPTNISGKFDAQGRYYTPAGGGNLVRTTDGTFMQKAAGGYIDTKTGTFVPAP